MDHRLVPCQVSLLVFFSECLGRRILGPRGIAGGSRSLVRGGRISRLMVTRNRRPRGGVPRSSVAGEPRGFVAISSGFSGGPSVRGIPRRSAGGTRESRWNSLSIEYQAAATPWHSPKLLLWMAIGEGLGGSSRSPGMRKVTFSGLLGYILSHRAARVGNEPGFQDENAGSRQIPETRDSGVGNELDLDFKMSGNSDRRWVVVDAGRDVESMFCSVWIATRHVVARGYVV